jgi:surfactin synthase thioesterase subunit
VADTIGNLSFHRGGCVIFMDYSRYSTGAYSNLVRHFHALARVLIKKIRQATDNYENVFMYGFSFGARLAFEAGATIGYQKIERIDACDPAGPA